MQGAVRQIAVYRSRNIHCRKVKIVSATRGEGKLLRPIFYRQRNICEITCVIGIIITVILFIEDLQGIVARCNVRRDFDFNRSAFGSRLCYSAVILCAVVIRQDDRDIFIYPCGRPFVIQRNGIVGGGIGSFSITAKLRLLSKSVNFHSFPLYSGIGVSPPSGFPPTATDAKGQSSDLI